MIFTGCSGSAPEGTRQPLYIKGMKLQKAEQYKQAAAVFERCLRQDPTNRPAHVQLGMLYDDHLNNPVAALYHYHEGAAGGAEDAHAQVARHAADVLIKRLVAQHLEDTPDDSATSSDASGKTIEQLNNQVRELIRQRAFLQKQLKTTVARLQTAENELARLRGSRSPPDPEKETVSTVRTYRVQKGDTLIGITRKHYGSSAYWQALKEYNRRELRGGDQVIPGMALRIPPKATLAGEAEQ